MEVLSKGERLRGRSISEGRGLRAVVSASLDAILDHGVTHQHRQPQLLDQRLSAHPDLAVSLDLALVNDLLRTPVPATWRCCSEQKGALLLLRVRCACSPPVVARSPPAPGRAGRAD